MTMGSFLLAALVALTNEFGRVETDTLGARVLSYVPNGGQEVFFRQSGPQKPGVWYNAGVPVCWPWFGRNGDPGTALHGFAWKREWTLLSRTDGPDESKAVFGLEEPGAWRLEYEVVLGRSLTMRLTMRNLGKERIVVTTGLHPYFAASRPENVVVRVPGKDIVCQAGMDGARPYGEGTYEVLDRGTGRRLSLRMFGNNKIVIWNLGTEDKVEGMPGDDWSRFVCVEPAVLPRCDGFYLNPGETRSIGFACTVLESGK